MGKLHLKYDGVLAEQFSPLDPPPPYIPPNKWDAPHVQHRFAEALGVVGRLPGRVWPRSYANSWPKDYQSEWADMLAMLADGGDAHAQWAREQNYSVRSRPTSIEIQRCEAALCWPGQYLRYKPELGRALNVVGLATSREVGVEDVVQRGRHRGVKSPAAWRELAYEAAHVVAVGLRVDCVGVF